MQDIEIFISSVQLPSFCMKNNALKLDWTLFWKCFQGTALQEGTVNSLFALGGQLHSGISLCCAKWQPAGLALGKGIGCQEQRALEKNLFCLVTDTQQGWCLPSKGKELGVPSPLPEQQRGWLSRPFPSNSLSPSPFPVVSKTHLQSLTDWGSRRAVQAGWQSQFL